MKNQGWKNVGKQSRFFGFRIFETTTGHNITSLETKNISTGNTNQFTACATLTNIDINSYINEKIIKEMTFDICPGLKPKNLKFALLFFIVFKLLRPRFFFENANAKL